MGWLTEHMRGLPDGLSFHDFMDLALYDPAHGYYGGGSRPGRSGDFLTAPTASHWYARALGGVTAALGRRLGGVTLVDVAAGEGALLAQLAADPPAGLEGMVAVERSARLRERLAERLTGAAVPWRAVAGIEEAERPHGAVVLHASELYDALPVHRVVGRAGGLAELWVRLHGDALAWGERAAPAALADYLEGHGVRLQEGQVAELNLAAEPLHRRLLTWAGRAAAALVLDYGYTARRLYDARARRGGSLATFRGHRMGRDPLAAPGGQDLTAHVNWDDLRRAATASGWLEIGLWPLAELLMRAGLPSLVETAGLGIEAELDAATLVERQELKRLLDPDGMGSDLKVLVQASPAIAAEVEAVLAM